MDYLQYTQEIARLARENETYLAHHGIKGQKHGERRYQYEDGSLTPLGRQHYGVGDGDDRQPSKPKPPAQRRRTSSTTKTKAQLEQELAEARAEAEKQRTHKKVAIGLGIAGTAAATIAAVILGKKLHDRNIELESMKQAAEAGAEKLKKIEGLKDSLQSQLGEATANLKKAENDRDIAIADKTKAESDRDEEREISKAFRKQRNEAQQEAYKAKNALKTEKERHEVTKNEKAQMEEKYYEMSNDKINAIRRANQTQRQLDYEKRKHQEDNETNRKVISDRDSQLASEKRQREEQKNSYEKELVLQSARHQAELKKKDQDYQDSLSAWEAHNADLYKRITEEQQKAATDREAVKSLTKVIEGQKTDLAEANKKAEQERAYKMKLADAMKTAREDITKRDAKINELVSIVNRNAHITDNNKTAAKEAASAKRQLYNMQQNAANQGLLNRIIGRLPKLKFGS